MNAKTIKHGEWWFSNDRQTRCYICGFDPDGDPVFLTEPTLRPDTDTMVDFLACWHHENLCTGWEWQPEPESEWFDLTPLDGHVLRAGVDEGHCTLAGRNKWVEGVEWPEATTVAIAKSWRWNQFRCLLKDAPKPSEDPDEWVTQDRVPARPGIDKYQWLRAANSPDRDSWSSVKRETTLKHGDKDNADLIFNVRCRRKDLPLIPEQKPATRTIVFYEFIVRCGVGNEDWQLKWRTSKPKTNNWIPTGRTETREVVR